MEEKYKKIIESSYIQLAIIFTIAVFLKEIGILPVSFINFILFAFILPIFAIAALLHTKEDEVYRIRYAAIIILIIVLFVFTVRIIPYSNNSVPLGYDPGIYKYAMDTYIGSLPQIPEGDLPLWIKVTFEQGILVLMDVMHIFTSITPEDSLLYLMPFFCAILVLPVFILTRTIFNESAALIASILYAVSYTQYTAFTYLYFKNILGLFFLLLAIYALEKRKYILLSIMYAALGIYHRPEFLLFSLILIPYFIKNRSKGIIYATLGTAILILPFWLERIMINLEMVSGIGQTMISSLQGETVGGGGTFFGPEEYKWFSLAYLPFGLIGTLYLLARKKWNSVLFYLLINGIIVVFKLFFYNRLIISLDIVLIILASAGIYYAFLKSRDAPRYIAVAAVCLLVFASGIITLKSAYTSKPLINEKQLNTVEWISSNTPPDSYVLATSYDAPWVLGWSNRRVLAPGMFEWDNSGKEKWLRFLATNDSSEAGNFLKKHDAKVYIFYSFNKFNWMNLEKFNNSSFTKILMKDAVVYRYDGNE